MNKIFAFIPVIAVFAAVFSSVAYSAGTPVIAKFGYSNERMISGSTTDILWTVKNGISQKMEFVCPAGVSIKSGKKEICNAGAIKVTGSKQKISVSMSGTGTKQAVVFLTAENKSGKVSASTILNIIPQGGVQSDSAPIAANFTSFKPLMMNYVSSGDRLNLSWTAEGAAYYEINTTCPAGIKIMTDGKDRCGTKIIKPADYNSASLIAQSKSSSLEQAIFNICAYGRQNGPENCRRASIIIFAGATDPKINSFSLASDSIISEGSLYAFWNGANIEEYSMRANCPAGISAMANGSAICGKDIALLNKTDIIFSFANDTRYADKITLTLTGKGGGKSVSKETAIVVNPALPKITSFRTASQRSVSGEGMNVYWEGDNTKEYSISANCDDGVAVNLIGNNICGRKAGAGKGGATLSFINSGSLQGKAQITLYAKAGIFSDERTETVMVLPSKK